MTFSKKISNFWYHYKIYIVIVTVLVLIGTFLTVNLITKPVYDVNVIVFTESSVYDADIEAVQTAIAEKMGDVNGDGKVEIGVKALYLANNGASGTLYEQLTLEMMKGKTTLILCDENCARTLLNYGETVESLNGLVYPTCFDGRGYKVSTEALGVKESYLLPASFVIFTRNAEENEYQSVLNFVEKLPPFEEETE